jgi:hypothetical protein
MRIILVLYFFLGLQLGIAQQQGTTLINGQVMPFVIDECGDTVIVATLEDISVSSLRSFKDDTEYRRYLQYKRYAVKVYPYAVEAIKVFRELELQTEEMRKGKRRKYAKELYQGLKDDFKDPLKKLTKLQGMILIKMIEKEVDTPMFDLIKELRGGPTAAYWNTFGKMFGHEIKTGYVEGADPILDAVLNDLDVSYSVVKSNP